MSQEEEDKKKGPAQTVRLELNWRHTAVAAIVVFVLLELIFLSFQKLSRHDGPGPKETPVKENAANAIIPDPPPEKEATTNEGPSLMDAGTSAQGGDSIIPDAADIDPAPKREVHLDGTIEEDLAPTPSRKEEKPGSSASTAPASGPIQDEPSSLSSYQAEVADVLYSRWRVPLSITRPEKISYEVKIEIGSDGEILSSTALKASGDPELDRSVEDMLERVGRLPPPPLGAGKKSLTLPLRFSPRSEPI